MNSKKYIEFSTNKKINEDNLDDNNFEVNKKKQ